MRILFVSDWHNKKYELPDSKIDLLISLGDFDWKTIDMLDKTYSCEKIGLLGNHDRKDTYRGTDFKHLHAKTIEIQGIKIAGFDGCPKYNTREIAQYEEKDVEAFINNIGYVDIFVAHANPMIETNHDRTNAHRGFKSFYDYIKETQPEYFVHGHNHIDKRYQISRTKILSVYPYFMLEL